MAHAGSRTRVETRFGPIACVNYQAMVSIPITVPLARAKELGKTGSPSANKNPAITEATAGPEQRRGQGPSYYRRDANATPPAAASQDNRQEFEMKHLDVSSLRM